MLCCVHNDNERTHSATTPHWHQRMPNEKLREELRKLGVASRDVATAESPLAESKDHAARAAKGRSRRQRMPRTKRGRTTRRLDPLRRSWRSTSDICKMYVWYGDSWALNPYKHFVFHSDKPSIHAKQLWLRGEKNFDWKLRTSYFIQNLLTCAKELLI